MCFYCSELLLYYWHGNKMNIPFISFARLSHEWQAFISRTHKLRKVFISVKGIYYQVCQDLYCDMGCYVKHFIIQSIVLSLLFV